MSIESKTGRVELSWPRRQWLKITAIIEDHPRTVIVASLVSLAVAGFYATRLGGISHFLQSGARWRVESFGGTLKVDRAVRTPDVILSFEGADYNRLDVVAPTAAHLGGTAFREELLRLVGREGGLIRICALDPRLSLSSTAEFRDLAAAFGMTSIELGARCWYSTAVLLHLQEELGDRIEIRLITKPTAGASAPYFCIGRSGHAYFSDGRKDRLDTIVPRPAEPTGSDSFTHPGMIVKNRPKQVDVVRFTAAFASTWESALPLDGDQREQLLEHFDGQ